jgi:hypothetical protein
MTRMLYFTVWVMLATACRAQAVRGMADVAVIDRDRGVALTLYLYHGEYWVAGTPGARYAIEIRNRLGERLLAVTSVDGINVISGASAGWDQVGYVFRAGDQYQITGWRKSDAEVAAFTFADWSNSYAVRTGRAANVGIIGIAIFRERRPEPLYSAPRIIGRTAESAAQSAKGAAAADETVIVTAQARAPTTAAAAAAAKLGTAHGDREYSYVSQTDFLRSQPEPNEVIRIHYDSLDDLVARGIVQRPRPEPASVNPFPASPDQRYAPDPPG